MTARMIGNMTLTTPSDREIHMSRVFDAPATHVFDAFTKPELLRRWLGVHNGWRMTHCDIDLRVGGAYRYEWSGREGMSMGMGGHYQEIVRDQRLVATEKFDESWYPGEAIGTTTFVEVAGKTTLTMAVMYESKEARDAVLKTPMEQGVAAGLDTLALVLRMAAARVDTPQIAHTEQQHTAVIRLNVPLAQVRDVMGPGITEVFAAIQSQGMTPAGAWVNHHFKNPGTHFDFEIAVPVNKPITPTGRVTASTWPAMKVVRAVFHGNYDGLHQAWPAFDAWIAANGLKTSGELWEQYVHGPQSTENPAEYRTELSRQVIE